MKFSQLVSVVLYLSDIATGRYLNSRTTPNFSKRHPFLGKRQDEQVCRYVCSPNACGGASCNIGGNAASEKRDEDTSEFGEDGFYNGTSFESDLTKRKLNAVTPRGIGRYVSFRNGGLGDLDKLCPVLGATRDQPTYCIERTFAHAFTDGGQFRMGTADTLLTGCTILVVVSARAAYMCHIWEDAHYTNAGNGRFEGFHHALNLVGGGAPGAHTGGSSLTPGLYNQPGDNPLMYVMTPLQRNRPRGNTDLMQYPNEFMSLYGLVNAMIPSIPLYWHFYESFNKDDVDNRNNRGPLQTGNRKKERSWRSLAMFEFDKNADGQGNPDWRLWMEYKSVTGSQMGQNVRA